jgi:hypothetical protein
MGAATPAFARLVGALAAVLAVGLVDDARAAGPVLTLQGEERGPVTGYFGYAVAVSADGNTALVGAPLENGDVGAAYVFVRNGSTWSQQARLVASDGAPSDVFGNAVALNGNMAFVGALGRRSSAGAVYVFTGSGSSWSETQVLTASDAAAQQRFGSSLASSGTELLVGAPGRAVAGLGGAGSAYVFSLAIAAGSWSETQVLAAADAAANDSFGGAVAATPLTAWIGATGRGSGAGAAYVFSRSGAAWSQSQTLTPADAAAGDAFGGAVALTATTALVGAARKNGSTGAVYAFGTGGGGWSEQQRLVAPDGVTGDQFGTSVALGAFAVVGAPGKSGSSGAAYVLSPAGGWSFAQEMAAPDGVANGYFGFSAAVAPGSAALGAVLDGNGAMYLLASPVTPVPALGWQAIWLALGLGAIGIAAMKRRTPDRRSNE